MEKHQAEITAGAAAAGGIFCTTCGAQVQLNLVMEFHFEIELLSNNCFTKVKDEASLYSHMARSHGVKEVTNNANWNNAATFNQNTSRFTNNQDSMQLQQQQQQQQPQPQQV